MPRERYQISRLKCIPTDNPTATNKTKFQVGYFQGAYCVPGTTYFSLVSLRDEWVDFQFEQGFVRSVKAQALSGFNNATELIPVPPGKVNDQDKPDDKLVLYMRLCKFQQKTNSTCLMDSFCSDMDAFGCHQQVLALRNNPQCKSVSAACHNMWDVFGRLVNNSFSDLGLRLYKKREE